MFLFLIGLSLTLPTTDLYTSFHLSNITKGKNIHFFFTSSTPTATPKKPSSTPIPSTTQPKYSNTSTPIPPISDAEASVVSAKISATVALIAAILSVIITGVSLIVQKRIANEQIKVQINQLDARYKEVQFDLEQKQIELNESRRQFEQKIQLDQKKLALEFPSSLNEDAVRLLHQLQPTLVETPIITGTPYVIGPAVTPANFIGRKELVSQIFSRLQSAQMMSTSLIGLQRAGKTSLLNYLRNEVVIRTHMKENSNSFLLCYINMQNDINSPAEFYSHMIRAAIQSLAAKRNIQDYSLNGEVSRRGLENFLDATMSLGINLVYLVDEFDRVSGSNFDRDFLEGLRALSSDRKLAWVLVSHNSLDLIGHKMSIPAGSPFYNIITPPPLYVGPLSLEDAKHLIRNPTRDINIEVDDNDISFLVELAGFLPFSLQMASAFLWDKKNKSIPSENVREEVKNLFYEAMKPYYVHHWEQQLSSKEQQILLDFANRDFNLPIDKNNYPVAAIQKLKSLGIISETEFRYEITSKAFRQWVHELNSYPFRNH